MSSRTLLWSVTMTVIAAVYFCTAPTTHAVGEANKLPTELLRQLNAE